MHNDYYSKVYNQYSIRYEHTDDPYYQAAKLLLEQCPKASKSDLLHTIQETVQIRQSKLNNLLASIGVSDKGPPLLRSFGYVLIDAKDSHEIVRILAPFLWIMKSRI